MIPSQRPLLWSDVAGYLAAKRLWATRQLSSTRAMKTSAMKTAVSLFKPWVNMCSPPLHWFPNWLPSIWFHFSLPVLAQTAHPDPGNLPWAHTLSFPKNNFIFHSHLLVYSVSPLRPVVLCTVNSEFKRSLTLTRTVEITHFKNLLFS